jgi:hypothetical protein
MFPAISASLPVWLCVSSEKPSSKLEGARLMPGASCTNLVGEAGPCSAMVRWRMLCGVRRSSHARTSVLVVADIQLVMLFMLVVVRARLLHVRGSVTVSRESCMVSPMWFAVAACVSGIQDLNTTNNQERPRSTASPRRYRRRPRDAASPRFGRAALSGRLGWITWSFLSTGTRKAGIPQLFHGS